MDTARVSAAIIEHARKIHLEEEEEPGRAVEADLAKPILITPEAYASLTQAFAGVSDEHRMQFFVQYLSH